LDYGIPVIRQLPVGGPAARLLSELLLNRVDRLLTSENIKFCRFVDDYVVYTHSREEAQSALIKLTQLLIKNKGLPSLSVHLSCYDAILYVS
jgi:retron-type reverse transcriptase